MPLEPLGLAIMAVALALVWLTSLTVTLVTRCRSLALIVTTTEDASRVMALSVGGGDVPCPGSTAAMATLNVSPGSSAVSLVMGMPTVRTASHRKSVMASSGLSLRSTRKKSSSTNLKAPACAVIAV